MAVTGATGHVGANLVRALLARGRRVRVLLHRDRRAIAGLDVEAVKGDVCDLDSLLTAFEGAEVVYHLAAHISIFGGERTLLKQVNVAGTRNVIEACKRRGVRRLVHFSSIHSLMHNTPDAPLNELTPLAVSDHYPPYDCSKATAEREVQKAIAGGMDAVIISPTAIIGPYDYKPSHFGEALLRLAKGALPALVSGGFDWVDARDVVQGAMRAEEIAPPGAKYILSGHWASLREVATIVEEITGVPAPRFDFPVWAAAIGAPLMSAIDRACGRRPLYTSVSLRAVKCRYKVSHEKATRELGYRPRPFRETITDTIHWFAENGWLPRSPRLPGK
ncbi:MAG: NAD-dependent epimerase/dehydratase family protein [Dehalococcoidales bacterium]|nr:NAD-dependent epimerase/dehydratase family protein [Dehalococcoidales bacterium]